MVKLSVNVNKVATLRNARGEDVPNVLEATLACVEAGAHGITVHPRADERHIRREDVYEIHQAIGVEFNIEGDPRPEWVDLVLDVKPTQCTLVPVRPGEVTSDHGWDFAKEGKSLVPIIRRLKDAGIRVSVFTGSDPEDMDRAKDAGADRVEFYTAPFAWAKKGPERTAEFETLKRAAERAGEVGLGINAGHDLNLDNLPQIRNLPGLLEVSIGHYLISHALYVGLERAVKDYLKALGH